MLKVSSGTFSITTYLLLRWEYAQMNSDEHFSPEEVIAPPTTSIYLKEHQIQGVVLKKADLHGVYFQKPSRRERETSDN